MTALTIATLNLWGHTGRWRDRMAVAADALAAQQVQVLLAQEADSVAECLAKKLGMDCVLAPVGVPGFSLAILSSLAIAEQRQLVLPSPGAEERTLLSVKLGEPEVWLHCTHLSHRLDACSMRQAQVARIAQELRAIDDQALHILGGDLNAEPSSDEMRFLRGLCSLSATSMHMQDAWLRHHPEDAHGFTWSMQRGAARMARSIDVDRRIDYLYVGTRRADGRGTVEDSGKVCDEASDTGLHASDHCGVWARVQS